MEEMDFDFYFYSDLNLLVEHDHHDRHDENLVDKMMMEEEELKE
jgi:hypothetical protein